MNADEFANLIKGARKSGAGWVGKCPAHDDRRASLSFRDEGDRILLYCHARCAPEKIVATLGLSMADFFHDAPASSNGRPPLPPQNIEAEERVLGALLLDPGMVAPVMEVLRPEHFYRPGHRAIFEAMIRLFERSEPIDILTVVDALKKEGKLEAAGGPESVARLADDVSSARRAVTHAKLVRNTAILRSLIQASNAIAERAFTAEEEVEGLVDDAERLIQEVRNSFPLPKGKVGNESNFSPVGAVEILAQAEESIPWVWEPFIAEGSLNLLAAFMKAGKSTFAYPLALAVAQGRPFLGFPTRRGGVLILAVEEHPRDVRRRLRQLGMGPDDPTYVHYGRLDAGPRALRDLRQFISGKEISLVLLDTLTRWWSLENENDNARIVREVSPLLDLARESGAAILLVHHDRKSGGEDGRNIRGGGALFGLVDQALLLERRQGGDGRDRILKAFGRYAETPPGLVIRLGEGGEFCVLGTSQDVGAEADREKVLGALSKEPKTVETLAEETDLKEKRVREVLGALGERVVRVGKGIKGSPFSYRLAEHTDSIRSQPPPMGEETNPRGNGRAASAVAPFPGLEEFALGPEEPF